MPTYTFVNKKTKKVVDTVSMTISEMEQYLKENPDLDTAPMSPRLGYTFLRMKPSDDFRERLREIKKHYPGSTINIP